MTTPARTRVLSPHPRLSIGPREIARLRQPLDTPLLRRAGRQVDALADEAARSPVFDWNRNTHNAHLIRARRMQGRVLTLAVQWLRTGDGRFRRAVVEHVAEMGRWEYWSWIAWRDNDPRPEATFDLSYGENSMTLAFAYDLLFDALSETERRMFVDIARRRAIRPCATRNAGGKTLCWWWTRYDSNWLTVCGGGAGLLCLAMHEEVPEARTLLPRLDRQLIGYMRNAQQCDGGWPEGVGYWNYGMRYGYLYWLGHERATGRRHAALRLPAAARTLWFPGDFSPNDVGTGFGDIPVPWKPEPFHYAAAERFGEHALVPTMDAIVARTPSYSGTHWPWAAEYLLYRPREKSAVAAAQRPRVRLYPKMQWGYLADRMPEPRLYLSFRGGSTADPHAHLDVLSFACVVGRELMLGPAVMLSYLDTTFSDRGFEMFEKNWASKNTIVIGGVGLSHPAKATTEPIRLGAGAEGFRLDAPGAIRINYRGEQVQALTRVLLMLRRRAFLVLDRVVLRCTNQIESRFRTPVRAAIKGERATLAGRREAAAMTFAATVPCKLVRAGTIPTCPQSPPTTLLRWCSESLERDVLFAALIVPGRRAGRLTITRVKSGFAVKASGMGFKSVLRLAEDLRPMR